MYRQEDSGQKTLICIEEGGAEETAVSLARRLHAPIVKEPQDGLTLVFGKDGVSLKGYGMTFRGDYEQMLHRITGGRLPHEMLVHVAKTKEMSPRAIDAAAGMGEDAMLLAAAGYEVTMYEQNPVIAALLRDALERAKPHPVLGPIADRMRLVEGNSIELMGNQEKPVDLVYLDPMFPKRQKSGLIQKKLQLIQKLESPCLEEEQLLEAALSVNPKKIIIKRPLKGPYLAGRTPAYTVKGKAIRYDCLVL